MTGLLRRCAASAEGAAAMVATGRWYVPEARWGKTGRYLPSYQSVAAFVAGGSGLLARASAALQPKLAGPPASIFTEVTTPSPALAPRRVDRAADKALPKTAPLPGSIGEDPDLAAIRALIDDAPVVATDKPARHQPHPTEGPAPATGKPVNWLQDRLAAIAGTALGYGLLVMALPYGAVRAGLAHLNGEDLRKLEV